MKHLLVIVLLSLSSISFDSQSAVLAGEIELYQVEQDSIKVVIAPKSGLPKASCKFYGKGHNLIAGQIVTIAEQWDNITIIEAQFYHEQHAKIVKVKCNK